MAETQPIIVKRVKKGGHGHHGGAWKVAYADFVTAMMAFFLLLWLLNAVSQDQLEGISNYFAPTSVSRSTSGGGGVLGGSSLAVEGTLPGLGASSPSVTMDLPPPKAGAGPQEESDKQAAPSQESAEELLKKKEEQQFQDAKSQLQKALDEFPQFKQLANNLEIDSTPEGLRIQIVDREGMAMFPRGSAKMFDHTRQALELVAKVVNKMPQEITITGHTDATKFVGGDSGYTNWELSADRANSSRRALTELGVDPKRLTRVSGVAEQDPLVKDNPTDPTNRRIAIVLLRGTGQTKTGTEAPPAAPPGPARATGAPAPVAPIPATRSAPMPPPRGPAK